MGFVAEYESATWFTEDAAAATVTCADGDVLVAGAVCGNQLRTLGISGGGLTWVQHGVVSATARCSITQWTAVVGAGQGGTFAVTATFSGDGAGGLGVRRYDQIASVGNSAVGNAAGPAAPALIITTTAADSIVDVIVGDHSTVDGAARAWRTADAGALTETTYWRTNFENAAYAGHHPAAGAAGAKTVGLTAPSMRYSIAAVELVPEAEAAELPLDPAGETDTARPLGAAKARTLGPAGVVEEARPLGRHKTLALGTAVDTSAAQPLAAGKARTLGPAGETAAVQDLGAAKTRALGTATETDRAVAFEEELQTVVAGGFGVPIRPIIDAAVSWAQRCARFETVNGGELTHVPGQGLRAAVWVDLGDGIKSSGLDAVSMRMDVLVRVYGPVHRQPVDEIDPDLVDAIDALGAAYCEDFTLGGLVRQIDVLGAHGPPLGFRAGYYDLEDGSGTCRVMTLRLPVIVNDVWFYG